MDLLSADISHTLIDLRIALESISRRGRDEVLG